MWNLGGLAGWRKDTIRLTLLVLPKKPAVKRRRTRSEPSFHGQLDFRTVSEVYAAGPVSRSSNQSGVEVRQW